MRKTIAELRSVEDVLERIAGFRGVNARALEIGCGQVLHQTLYFASKYDVVGIDLDVAPLGLNIASYWRQLRRNGPGRLAKTLARKLLGVDRRFAREMCRQLGATRMRQPTLIQMDATRMEFPDASFDFVYSFDVFEHLPDPGRVLDEAVRVLRPGGCAYISLHPVTSESGFHDLNIINRRRAHLPYWAHLRPEHRDKVHAGAFINGLLLGEWRALFHAKMPGVSLEARLTQDPVLIAELARLREQGELGGYSDEEALVARLLAVWRKPAA